MEDKKEYYRQSMDEIVFANRNKHYGAYLLRSLYRKRLLKSLCITIIVFVIVISVPKLLMMLHFFDEQEPELTQERTMILAELASSKPQYTPPAPSAPANQEIAPSPDPVPPPPDKPDDKDKNKNNPMNNGDSAKKGEPVNGNPTGVYLSGRVEKEPTFKGGEEALYTYMQNIVHPDITLKGTIVVTFIIDESGSVIEIHTDGKGNPKLEQAAIDAVTKMSGKWNPGMQNNRPVKVICKIPISF